jgi:hypothetical protein
MTAAVKGAKNPDLRHEHEIPFDSSGQAPALRAAEW